MGGVIYKIFIPICHYIKFDYVTNSILSFLDSVLVTVGQGPIALAVGAGGGCLDIFSLIYLFFFLSPSLWETARYRLKYCLKGPLNPKQPTNQISSGRGSTVF